MSTQHWTPEEFRRRGHAMVDLVADYWARVQRTGQGAAWPVSGGRAPGETAALLPDRAPDQPEPWDSVVADIERVILPGLTHWQSPAFFGYFPANISPPAVLGELLSAGLGVQGMLWATSPACTEVETRVLDWMAHAVGLPDRFLSAGPAGGGVIQGTASEAVLVALVAARHRARQQGLAGGPVVYASNQAHSSIVKAAVIAGVADGVHARDGLVGGGVRLIPVDEHLRMDPAALARAIDDDRAGGRLPLMVCATVGTTGTMAIDDVEAAGRVCAERGVWLHVDAAMAGSACICPEHRWLLAGPGGTGLERVDSLCFNPHKGLLTNFDCSLLWTADRGSLTGALSITPEYLRNAATDAGAVWDYRDWQIPLGRRFRALKLWFVLRAYGLEGLRAHVREHDRLGGVLEGLVRADARFEAPVPRRLGLVCFRLRAGRGATEGLLQRVNARGRVFLSHTVLPSGEGRVGGEEGGEEGGAEGGVRGENPYLIRMAIGGTFTREEHVREAWAEIASQAGV